jgi:hypothetical protein
MRHGAWETNTNLLPIAYCLLPVNLAQEYFARELMHE